ncbi:MAG: general secretion pathway protein GspB [Alteromonas sp.]|nr:general secretion pathway protein GspB [Alteromonas sp.]
MLNEVSPLLLISMLVSPAGAQVLEDPTRPARAASQASAAVATDAVELQLEAVLQLGASRTAVINGKPVKQGQTIQGAVIKEINPRSVVIARDENGVWKTMTLWVSQRGNVKTNAAENY